MTTEPYIRVDGNIVCSDCEKPYKNHPREKMYDCNDGQEMWLVRACNGSLLKT